MDGGRMDGGRHATAIANWVLRNGRAKNDCSMESKQYASSQLLLVEFYGNIFPSWLKQFSHFRILSGSTSDVTPRVMHLSVTDNDHVTSSPQGACRQPAPAKRNQAGFTRSHNWSFRRHLTGQIIAADFQGHWAAKPARLFTRPLKWAVVTVDRWVMV